MGRKPKISPSLTLFLLRKVVLSERSGSLIRRTAKLSFFAISISVALFFIVIFVMNGMNQNIRQRLLALDPHISIDLHAQEIPDVLVRNQLGAIVGEVLRDKSSAGEYVLFERFDLILRTIDGQFRGAQVVGYDQTGLSNWKKRLFELRQKEGKLEDYQDLTLDVDEIAIGIDLSRMLGVFEGDEITLIPTETLLSSQLETPKFKKVVVKQILTTDLYDLDSKLVLYNRDLSMQNFRESPSREVGAHLWMNSASSIPRTLENIRGKLKSIPELAAVRIESWQQKNSDLFFALLLEKLVIGFFLGLAGLVASSSILTVLALIMSQKKNDIAILKTVGLSHGQTLFIFTKIGLLIAGSGILTGTALGLAASYYIQFYPIEILPQIYYDSTIPALVDLSFVGIVVFAALLLSFIGCYFPARATLKIQPAILLKTR